MNRSNWIQGDMPIKIGTPTGLLIDLNDTIMLKEDYKGVTVSVTLAGMKFMDDWVKFSIRFILNGVLFSHQFSSMSDERNRWEGKMEIKHYLREGDSLSIGLYQDSGGWTAVHSEVSLVFHE